MNEVETMLTGGKQEIDRLEVPEELELRLRNALTNRPRRQQVRKNWKMRLAAGFIVILLVGYNFDGLAFYGKKLIGYDQVMNGSLKQLNELGKGQIIGKSYSFKKGITVTLDGIMLDRNQLLAFYTVKNHDGLVEHADINPYMTITGIFGDYAIKNAQGEMNKEKTEIKYVASFETPIFFEKKLHLNVSLPQGAGLETGDIAFTLDRNKAMGYTLKKSLNETVKVDETKISFESIVASPTKTVIHGSIQNIINLAMDQIQGERFRPDNLEVKLIADGKAVNEQGGGLSTDVNGITFQKDYDPLPVNLKKLQIQLVSFGADHDVNQQIDLKKEEQDRSVRFLGQNVEINRVYEDNGDTYVTITIEEGVVLSRVYLVIDGKSTELQETISDSYNKKADGTVIHTRTLHFPGTGNELRLKVDRMNYAKKYNQIINIPNM